MMRKPVAGMSGLCATGAGHHLCHVTWQTPSADVTCRCACHKAKAPARVIVKKELVKKSHKIVAKVLVPKK